MEKRFPLALLLCFLVFLLWAKLNPPPAGPQPGDGAAGNAIFGEGSEQPLAPTPSGESFPVDPAGDPSAAQPDNPTVSVVGDGNTVTVNPPAVGRTPDNPLMVVAQSEEFYEQLLGQPGELGRYQARFSNRGARLLELKTADYYVRSHLTPEEQADPANWVTLLTTIQEAQGQSGSLLVDGGLNARDLFPRPLDSVLWQATELKGPEGAPTGMEFRYSPGNGYTITKRIERTGRPFEFGVRIAIECASDTPTKLSPGLRQLVVRPAGVAPVEYVDRFYQQPTAIAVGLGPKSGLELGAAKAVSSKQQVALFDVPAPVALAGVHVKYFAVLMRAKDSITEARTRTASYRHLLDLTEGLEASERQQVVADVNVDIDLPQPGETKALEYLVFAGPKDHKSFTEATRLHRKVIDSDLSTFSGIGRFLTQLMLLLEGLVGNFGVAIILLTVLVRGALFPLNRRAQTTMARYQSKMKRLQPQLDAIKKKHENDPQRLRQEQALVMQKEGLFPPLGGCLPVFLQLPIFFGLFSALRTNFELRQAPFVSWIDDLSRPDRLFALGDGLPFGLTHFNLLPLLMVVLWIWQQRTMPQPTDEQQKSMQRIMLFMPPVMGIFLYNYAAGLSLYMITQSGLGIIEQKVIKKVWPVDDKEVPRNAKQGCAPFAQRLAKMAEAQQAQQKKLLEQQRQTKERAKKAR